jgi:hypothetical protein
MPAAMRTAILLLLSLAAAGCHLADAPSTSDDAPNISSYDAQKLRAASGAAYANGQKK